MPMHSDFTLILGDSPITIGDSNRGGYPVWEKTFSTGGSEANSPGFLIFNVRHLTHSVGDVLVRINGKDVGFIYTYRPGGSDINTTDVNQPEKWRQTDHWYTQMIAFGGGQINDGDNSIRIEAVDYPEKTAANMYDDFLIKDMFCFFHKKT